MGWLIYFSCLPKSGTIRVSMMKVTATENMRNNFARPGNERLEFLAHSGGG